MKIFSSGLGADLLFVTSLALVTSLMSKAEFSKSLSSIFLDIT